MAPESERLDELDFATFIVSLAGSAMVHLGQAPPGPGEAPLAPNLPLAKQTIDILAVLQAKTAGNLDDDEDKLLRSILYQTRLAYVELTKGS